jgi:DNA helicase HerA-like ATPase
MSANKAHLVAAFGATGQGKSIYLKRCLQQLHPRRLLIWSPQEETDHYGQFGTLVTSLEREVFPVLLKKGGAFRLVYLPQGDMDTWPDQFNVICEISLKAGDNVLFVEELADVTSNFKRPAFWMQIVRKGRAAGVKIYVASQRPADIDKNLFSQATLVRTGRLNSEGDVKTLASVLMVPTDQVIALKPLEFIERDMQTGATRTGKLKI